MSKEGAIITVTNGTLIRLEAAKQALAEAKTLNDAKHIRDQAQAIQHYLREQRYSLEAQNDAAEIKLRAERRLGELLAEMPREQGKRTDRTSLQSATKLQDLGVEKTAAHRWQLQASVPAEQLESYIAETRQLGEELTSADVIRLAKNQRQQTIIAGRTYDDGCTVEDLQTLVEKGAQFGTIYADPPWKYGNQGTRSATDRHYETMTVEEIANLPIDKLAAADSHLHLWTTNAFLFECPRILDAWGFTYKSVFVWCKPQMGIGNYWRVSHEFLILATRGNAPFRNRSLKSWAEISRGRHSAKPEQVRHWIESASPLPYLELFGREAVRPWVVWGNEINRDMFHTQFARK